MAPLPDVRAITSSDPVTDHDVVVPHRHAISPRNGITDGGSGGRRGPAWRGGEQTPQRSPPLPYLPPQRRPARHAKHWAITPKVHTSEAAQASDYIITVGCGDACPYFPGKTHLDWQLEDPVGQGVEAVRPIRDEIKTLIEGLIVEIDARATVKKPLPPRLPVLSGPFPVRAVSRPGWDHTPFGRSPYPPGGPAEAPTRRPPGSTSDSSCPASVPNPAPKVSHTPPAETCPIAGPRHLRRSERCEPTPTATDPNPRAADSLRSGKVDAPTPKNQRFRRSETYAGGAGGTRTHGRRIMSPLL